MNGHKKKEKRILLLLADLLHIWHYIKLFISATLSWVHVSMISTYRLLLWCPGALVVGSSNIQSTS